jgi:HAD superfamily hydrolase (TIGR01509 family)
VIEAYVFDFDGLILDTESSAYHSIAEEFAAVGLAFELATWQQCIGVGWSVDWIDELERRCATPIDRARVLARRRARKNELLAGCDVLPGVVDRIAEARQHGLGLAVASSSPRDWVEPHLDRLGLLGRFDAVYTRDDVVNAKPAPDLFLAAAAHVDAAPSACIAFEDSHNGCHAAKAAGMRCVVVPNPITADQDFGHADLVVGSLEEVDLTDLRRLMRSRGGQAGEGGLATEATQQAQ